jgi:hypothetical protein
MKLQPLSRRHHRKQDTAGVVLKSGHGGGLQDDPRIHGPPRVTRVTEHWK